MILGQGVEPVDAILVDDVDHDQDREDSHREQAERYVDDQQPGRRHEDEENDARRERERRQDVHSRIDIDASACCKVAAGTGLVPRNRLLHQSVEDLHNECLGNPPMCPAGPRPAHDDAGSTDQSDTDDERDTDHDRPDRDVPLTETRIDHVVDDPTQHDGRRNGAECEDRRTSNSDEERFRMDPNEVADEARCRLPALSARMR